MFFVLCDDLIDFLCSVFVRLHGQSPGGEEGHKVWPCGSTAGWVSACLQVLAGPRVSVGVHSNG